MLRSKSHSDWILDSKLEGFKPNEGPKLTQHLVYGAVQL